MPGIEDRLRGALNTMAGEVSASPDARTELDRRLASRRTPGPLLVAVAAAVVLAVVFVPIALGGGDDPVLTPPASDLITPETAALVMSVAAAGTGPNAWSLDLYEDVEDGELCFVVSTGQQWDGDPLCFAPPSFTGAGKVVPRDLAEMTRDLDMPPVLRDALNVKVLLLARPEVHTVDVRSTDEEEWASVASFARSGEEVSIFVGTFVGTHDGYRYAAKNRQGQVVERATVG